MKHVVVGTAGHIDHGKSALVEALTGTNPDRLKEEKERGITIDLGFAFLQPSDDLSLGFVDVPGHERFVKNMLAGVGGIDLVMLVVAADESVMPQTREHFEICRLLKTGRGLIVITKCDLVDDELSEIAALEARELVAGSFLQDAPLVKVSSKTGAGIEELKEVLAEAAQATEPRGTGGLFRLPVDRVFTMKGFGTVVTGTLIAGSVADDEEVEIMPPGRRSRVRGLQVHGHRASKAVAGQRTAINLQGIELGDISRGEVLAPPGCFRPTSMLDAELEVLGSSPVSIKDLTRVHLHLGTAQVLARVRVLGGVKEIGAGTSGLVQLRLETPLVAARGDRFILRRYSPLETIAGGRVLDAYPDKHSVKSRAVVDALSLLQEADLSSSALHFIRLADSDGVTAPDLARRLAIRPTELDRLAASLSPDEVLTTAARPPIFVAATALMALGERLLQQVKRFQREHPLREGMPKGELLEKVMRSGSPEVFELLVSRLVEAGKLRTARELVATPDHRIQMSEEETEAREFLLKAYQQAGYRPKSLGETAAESKRDLRVLERMERMLLKEGALVRITDGLVFHRDVLEGLKEQIRGYKEKSAKIDVALFKDMAGVTRKHAIPLLEWLDRQRVTRRVGNERLIL